MPVFVRSGGILTTRTDNVANDQQNPLNKVTVQVAEGADGSSSLYEDDGNTTTPSQHTSTPIDYRQTVRTDRSRSAPLVAPSRPGVPTGVDGELHQCDRTDGRIDQRP